MINDWLKLYIYVLSSMDIILSILVLSLAIVFMAAGILFGNKPLSGSCGGLNSNGICSYCGTEPKNCENL